MSYFDREIFFPDDDDNKRVLYVGMMGFRLAFQSIQQTPFERSEAWTFAFPAFWTKHKTFQGGEYVDIYRIGWFVIYGKIKLQTECEYVEKFNLTVFFHRISKGREKFQRE